MPLARGAPQTAVIDRGFHAAATDHAQVRDWGQRWPNALIGLPTGRSSGFIVLDIDVKLDRANGFDTLDALGFAILPETPMVHTASGGLHLYFALPDSDLRNTGGARGRGIGPGLDWRGEGGYVIAPAPGSGYEADPIWNLDTVAPAPVPLVLLPRQPEPRNMVRPITPRTGLSPYADAALDNACRRIIAAPPGEQETTLNSEAFAIGGLAGARVIPADFGRRTLVWAARQMRDHDPHRPWRAREIEGKVERAFENGMRRPREARRA